MSRAEYDKKRRSGKETLLRIAITGRKYKIKCRTVWDDHVKKSGFTKCCICGYNKCSQFLGFHHVIPGEKDISIGKLTGETPILERLNLFDEEVRKCIYICANCHGEIHNSLLHE